MSSLAIITMIVMKKAKREKENTTFKIKKIKLRSAQRSSDKKTLFFCLENMCICIQWEAVTRSCCSDHQKKNHKEEEEEFRSCRCSAARPLGSFHLGKCNQVTQVGGIILSFCCDPFKRVDVVGFGCVCPAVTCWLVQGVILPLLC